MLTGTTLIRNRLPDYRRALDTADAQALGPKAAGEVQRFLGLRADYAPTPLVPLPALAKAFGIGALHIKDEGQRLGLSSFKALGGAYATIRLAVEKAGEALGRGLAAPQHIPQATPGAQAVGDVVGRNHHRQAR